MKLPYAQNSAPIIIIVVVVVVKRKKFSQRPRLPGENAGWLARCFASIKSVNQSKVCIMMRIPLFFLLFFVFLVFVFFLDLFFLEGGGV